jgi:hypothetical protein
MMDARLKQRVCIKFYMNLRKVHRDFAVIKQGF